MKHKLDLSKNTCHVCGRPLFREIDKGTEKCIAFFCQVKNVNFTIPVIQEPEES